MPTCLTVQVEALEEVLRRKCFSQFSPCFVSPGLRPGVWRLFSICFGWDESSFLVQHFVNIHYSPLRIGVIIFSGCTIWEIERLPRRKWGPVDLGEVRGSTGGIVEACGIGVVDRHTCWSAARGSWKQPDWGLLTPG